MRLVDDGRRRLLDDLLVAALDRALAFAEVHDGAVCVADDLDLDVARVVDVALEEHRVVAEGGARLALGARDGLEEFGLVAHDAHAAAAAAVARLDQHGPADLVGGFHDGGVVHAGEVSAREHRHAGVLHDLARADLGAHELDRFGRRAHEREARRRRTPWRSRRSPTRKP